MDKEVLSVFQFNDYKVDFMDYKFNPNFNFDKPLDIDFSLKVDVSATDDYTKGKVSILCNVFKDAVSNNYPFSLNICVTGFFSSTDKINQKEMEKFCTINGTAALFPLLRSIVADVTKTANVETLILPLINVPKLMEDKMNRINDI